MILYIDPESYRHEIGRMLGQSLTDQEWQELDQWLVDMAQSTVHTYADHAVWLAIRMAGGFRPDFSPTAPPITTQAMQWRWDNLADAMNRMIERTAEILSAFWRDVQQAMPPKTGDYAEPTAGNIDPPPARPEARNENRPRQKYESPRWQPRRRK